MKPDDGATLILDKDNDCYFRKNFGLNGVVDARQCGVVGDGQPKDGMLPGGETHPDDAKVLNSCMGLVSQTTTLNLQNSLSVVTTGGGVILDNTRDIQIPLNVTLECGGTFTAASNNNDYRIFKSNGTPNLTGAIVIDPTNHGTVGAPVYFSVKSTGKNATYKDCTVVAGAGARDANNKYLNPYSPSVFYPDCQFPYDGTNGSGAAAPCTETADGSQYRDETRASTAIQSAFSNPRDTSGVITPGPAAGSIGIVSTAGLNVQNVRIIGFGTCITDNGPKPLTQNVDCDGSTGISIHTSDVPMIENTAIGADITTGELAFIIPAGTTGISWDTTHTPNAYQVTATLVSGNNFKFMDGDIAWITPQPGFGAQSANGYWKIANTVCVSVGAAKCTFNLVGSMQSVTQSANMNVNGLPASVLSLTDPSPANANLKFVQIGQTVTDQTNPGCISGLTVTNVWPARGLIYLSGPVGAGCSGPDTIKFADTIYTGLSGTCSLTNPGLGGGPPSGSTNGCAIVDPNFRWGDGIYTENSGGARAVNCQVYEHLVSWHLYDGTRSAFFSNCATGNANDLPDRNLAALTSTSYPSGNIVSVYIEGSHDHTNDDQSNETDACESDWSNMVLGQHRATNIVVQSDCDTPNRFANVSIGGGSGGIDFEMDAGGLSIVNEAGNSPAVMFKADKTTLYGRDNPALSYSLPANLSLSNDRSTKGNIIFANADAAATTIGCANVYSVPLNCPHTVAIGPTISVAGTIDASAQLWPCDATAGNVAINVPAGSANPNATFQVKKIDSTTHTCRIVMSGSDTLDGYPTYTFVNAQWQSVTFTNLRGSTTWYVTAEGSH